MGKLTRMFLASLFLLTLCVNLRAVEENYFTGKTYTQIGPPSRKFELAVSMFRVSGYSTVDKFGFNPSIGVGETPSDVWEFGGEYNYDAFGTAPILYLSSSDIDDTMSISVQGLDMKGDLVEQNATLSGQTNVSLTTPLWRVFRLESNANEGDDIEGSVYCHTDPTPTNGVPVDVAVRAVINGTNNQTLMSLYTIPRGKIGFLYRGELGVQLEGNVQSLAEYARVQYKSRRMGKVFKVKKDVSLMVGGGSALYQDPRSFPDIIPDLTDIKIEVKEVTQTMGVWSAFDIMLIDEKFFPESLLKEIGQYNYKD